MRIHRTTPTRAFSVFSNALLRDRTPSWCAVGVLAYLLSGASPPFVLPRSSARQRTPIAAALHELGESRYLRRVMRKLEKAGQFATVNEVFDSLCDGGALSGESEEVRNLTPALPQRSAPA